MPAKWLKDAVFYEIYPQSFKDSNGDGIGDFQGIIDKLDYVKSLGCNALWINPCFDSPFKDAGYDVRDYKKVAPRYGTNDDLVRLFDEAHKKGIRVLLDLVPGHTSEMHPWFLESQKAEKNEFSGRYIWTDSWFKGGAGMPHIGGECERAATYVLNFFKCQPALNYGFARVEQPWQLPVDHPDCVATREAIKDVMRFWLSHGCDGFRVDMANSLVKYDDERRGQVWHQPGVAGHPEDAGRRVPRRRDGLRMVPAQAGAAGGLRHGLLPELPRHRLFHADARLHRDIRRFLDIYLDWYEDTKDLGYISLVTCNHDTTRARWNLTVPEIKLAYAFLFTMPGVPFLYYGDEIGMRYLELPTKEGGYTRTGSRTPMQWNGGKNLGFSDGDPADLYLPVDPAADAPTVEGQEGDPDSMLNTVRALLKLRHDEEDLQADAPFEALCAEKGDRPLVYRRGRLLVAVNPSGESQSVKLDAPGRAVRFAIGSAAVTGGKLALGPQSFAVLK